METNGFHFYTTSAPLVTFHVLSVNVLTNSSLPNFPIEIILFLRYGTIGFGEIEGYEEAMQVETRKTWEQCMKEEIDSLLHNQTWDLVYFPTSKREL
jgi:hypothetical protein